MANIFERFDQEPIAAASLGKLDSYFLWFTVIYVSNFSLAKAF